MTKKVGIHIRTKRSLSCISTGHQSAKSRMKETRISEQHVAYPHHCAATVVSENYHVLREL